MNAPPRRLADIAAASNEKTLAKREASKAAMRENRALWTSLGLCYNGCGNKRAGGITYCRICADARNGYYAGRKKRAKA